MITYLSAANSCFKVTKIYVFIFFIVSFPIVTVAQCDCNTIGFEDNSLGCWRLRKGKFAGGNNFLWVENPSSESDQHRITDNGQFDEIANCISPNFLPQTAPGSSHSLRLGDADNGAKAASAGISFTVPASATLFQIQYAVVFFDPNHTVEDQPRFQVNVSTECGDYFVIADESINGFQSCSDNWRVKPWETVGIDLSDYIGQTVSIDFLSTDCKRGGHGGYAYIDVGCVELDVDIGSYCPGDASVTLSAPDGFNSYSWVNTTTGETFAGRTIDVTNVMGGETYRVDITSLAGCMASLEFTLPPLEDGGQIQIEYSGENGFCRGGSGELNISGNNINSISINGQQVSSQNITLSPLTTTTYNVIATTSDPCGEDASSTFTIEVYPFPEINLNASALVVCPGEIITLSYTPQSGIDYEWVGLGLSNQASIDLTPTETRVYQLRASSDNGCEVVREVQVIVVEQGEISYDLQDVIVCPPGSETEFFIGIDNVSEVVAGFIAFRTEGSDGNDTLRNVELTGGLFRLFPLEDMEIPIRFVSSGGCDTIEDVLSVIVQDDAPTLSLPDGPLNVCANEQTIIEVGGDFDGLIVEPEPISIVGNQVTVSPFQTTIYEFEALRSDCSSAFGSLRVDLADSPNYSASQTATACAGEAQVMLVNAEAGALVRWGHNSSMEPEQTVFPSESRYYYYEVFGDNLCSVRDSVFISALSSETIDYLLPNITICEGNSTELTVITGEEVSVQWSGFPPGLNKINIEPTITTDYQVNITSPSGCTTIEASVTIQVVPAVSLVDQVEDALLCNGDSLEVVLTGTNVDAFYWLEIDSLVNSLYLPFDTITSHTVYGVDFDSPQCPSPPMRFSVATTELPQVNFSLDNETPCSGESVAISVEFGDEVSSFQWSDTNTSESPREIIFDPNTDLSLIVFDSAGCSVVLPVPLLEVSESTLPVYTTQNLTVCEQEEVVINLMASNFSEVVWDNGAGNADGSSILFATQDTVLRFSISNPDDCISLRDSIVITVITLPELGVNETFSCPGAIALLPFPTDVDSILWMPLDTVVTTSITVEVENEITLSALLYKENCRVQELYMITTEDFALDLGQDSLEVCSGSLITLSSNATALDWTYSWFSPEGELGSEDSLLVTPNSSGYYYLVVETSNNCSFRDSLYVDVLSEEMIQYTTQNYTPCISEDVVVEIATSQDLDIIWENFSPNVNFQFIYSSGVDTILYFTLSSPLGCLSVSDSVLITFRDFDFSPPFPYTVCESEPFYFDFPEDVGVDSIRLIELDTTIYGDSLEVNFDQNIMVTAIAYGAGGCGKEFDLVVNSIPPNVSLGPVDGTVCLGDSILLITLGDVVSVLWLDNTNTSIGTDDTVIIFPQLNEQYFVTASDSRGCVLVDSISVNAVDPPVPTLNETDKQSCQGAEVQLRTSCDPLYSVRWNQEGVSCITSMFLDTTTIVPVAIVDTFGCNEVNDSVLITIIRQPVAELEVDQACVFPSQQITASFICDNCEISWNTGARGATYTIPNNFDREVLIVTAENECGIDSDSMLVRSNSCKYYAPTSFSPNGDGINDSWKIEYGCSVSQIENYQLRVYDRWGSLVFEARDPNTAWNGLTLNPNMYIWTLTYYDQICGHEVSANSYVYLTK